MTKVYSKSIIPAEVLSERQKQVAVASAARKNQVVLTVWKKSLLFNCDGFTVFDSSGTLVFRVDNYVAGGNREIVRVDNYAMDAYGFSLITIHRKRLSLSENWLVFDGETVMTLWFSVTKHINLLNGKSLAYVSSARSSKNNNGSNKENVIYEIEGSYTQRCCVVYDEKWRRVAEIQRKEALGRDVFRLFVEGVMDPTVAMAIIVVLEQMFGSSRHFSM